MLSLVGHWRPLAEGQIPSPLANSLDLSSAGACPNHCYFCNVRRTQREDGHMTDETFAQVLDVYKRHGVRSSCVAGGGESLANPRAEAYLDELGRSGTDFGVITNGRFWREIHSQCRFVNVSINAADAETYSRMSGSEAKYFDEVISHIKQWSAKGHYTTYKVMITDRNKKPGLLSASVEKALECGCKAVLFRFAMLPWDLVASSPEYVQLTDLEADLYEKEVEILRKHYPMLNIQMPLERYDRASRKFRPKRCSGAVVNFVTLWNGDVFLCSDMRTNPHFRLCHISEFDEYWGSQRHKDLVAAVNPATCPRCSFLMHDTILDQFVYNDVANQFFI